MASMNNKSFLKILNLLDIPSSDLVRELYVSQSLVSRWKTGDRELKTANEYYAQLLRFFLEANRRQGKRRLEGFLLPRGRFPKDLAPEGEEEYLRQKLDFYLQQYDASLETRTLKKSGFETVIGVDERISTLINFFQTILEMNPKPDLYIMEVQYSRWSPQHIDWTAICFSYGLRYMDAGGVIYYFSNLHNFERAKFYRGWKFTSHKNLYPGYSANMAEESPGCAYYLAENALSVSFFAPEDSPKDYITMITSDKVTIQAQQNYLKKKYAMRNHQIFINAAEKRQLVTNVVDLHQNRINPLLFAGKHPSFLFLTAEQLSRLLKDNGVSERAARLCLDFHESLTRQLSDRIFTKTFFCYKEDLTEFLEDPSVFDEELTGVCGEPVHLTAEAKRELLQGMKRACVDPAYEIYVLSKYTQPIYEVLGENVSLWVKYNDWYLIFYNEEDRRTDMRLILDNMACVLRYDLFHQTLGNVAINTMETLEFLSAAIQTLEEQE